MSELTDLTDNAVPEMSSRTRRWSLRLIRAGGIVVTAWLLLYAYSQTVPYEPYRVEAYRAIPDAVCPGGAVRVDVTRYADPDGNIQSITTRTYWQETTTNVSPGVTEFVTVWNDRSNVYGTRTVPSNILRDIPQESGTYRIVSEYDVLGRILLFDRTDTYSIRSEAVLTVLPEDDPECGDA